MHPKKKWGQNFLHDKNIARKIVAAISWETDPLVIEIGPGQGALTEFLVGKEQPYIGVEIDPALAAGLRERYGNLPNVQIIEEDVLKWDLGGVLAGYPGREVVVVGNLPYNITSPTLFKLFEQADALGQAVLMMQLEVADRLVSAQGRKSYGLLSIFGQIFSDANRLFKVSPKVFYPVPKVHSAVVQLRFHQDATADISDFKLFRQIVRHCFQHRRKMLRKSLSTLFPAEQLAKLGGDLTRRPEELSLSQWKELVEEIYLLQEQKEGP